MKRCLPNVNSQGNLLNQEDFTMSCHHLTLTDRVKLETWIGEGYTLSQIATRLGFARSTITREIQRATKNRRFGMSIGACHTK